MQKVKFTTHNTPPYTTLSMSLPQELYSFSAPTLADFMHKSLKIQVQYELQKLHITPVHILYLLNTNLLPEITQLIVQNIYYPSCHVISAWCKNDIIRKLWYTICDIPMYIKQQMNYQNSLTFQQEFNDLIAEFSGKSPVDNVIMIYHRCYDCDTIILNTFAAMLNPKCILLLAKALHSTTKKMYVRSSLVTNKNAYSVHNFAENTHNNSSYNHIYLLVRDD
jgi:hypothetical protein